MILPYTPDLLLFTPDLLIRLREYYPETGAANRADREPVRNKLSSKSVLSKYSKFMGNLRIYSKTNLNLIKSL